MKACRGGKRRNPMAPVGPERGALHAVVAARVRLLGPPVEQRQQLLWPVQRAVRGPLGRLPHRVARARYAPVRLQHLREGIEHA